MININTKEYWEQRFSSGDWETKGGNNQTAQFAQSQLQHFDMPENFSGTILDFGCGLGDAIPLYHQKYPKAKLIGLDISESAIESCRTKFGNIAEFISGDHTNVPAGVNVIIASNVFEHLTGGEEIARVLSSKCDALYIIVPFEENMVTGCKEHVNRYSRNSFQNIKTSWIKIFTSKGWSEFGVNLYFNVYFKNILRPFFGKRIAKRNMQIMFKMSK